MESDESLREEVLRLEYLWSGIFIGDRLRVGRGIRR